MQGGFPTAPSPKPSSLGLVALLLSIAGCLVFPVLAAGFGLAFNRSSTGFVTVVVALVVGAVAVIAATVLAAGGPVPDTSSLDPAVRRALADAWTVDASLEHASIAAFSALSLDLLAMGAPPSLVARAHRAAMDEVAHASDCFALASAYSGEALSAARFPEVRAAQPSEDDASRLRRLAVETAVDGCVGEATAAAVARAMARVRLEGEHSAALGRRRAAA